MLDRSVAPPSEAIHKPTFPDFKTYSLAHGASLYSINQGEQPVIMMELAVPISPLVEPEVSYFLCKMLMEGTRTKSSEEIAEALEYYGSHLEATPSFDHIFIRLYSLKRFFAIQLQLLEELLLESTLPESEFEVTRSIRIQQLQQQQAKTSTVASQRFRQSLFGKDHFYGKIVLPEVTKALTLAEVKAYYETDFRVVPTVFLTGEVSEAEISLMQDFIGRLEFRHAGSKMIDANYTTELVSFPWKNAVQTSIRLGGQSITRSHPDVHLLKIANDLFGGFFGSRLMKNIREEKGLTYGIHSGITHLAGASYWTVSTDVLKEKADLAISEIRMELQKLIDTPPSMEELETVINYSKGKFLMSFDSAFNSMSMIRGLILSGLDYTYWHAFLNTLDTMKPEHLSDVLGKHFSLEKLTVVKVG